MVNPRQNKVRRYTHCLTSDDANEDASGNVGEGGKNFLFHDSLLFC